jgi:hypothetical protein
MRRGELRRMIREELLAERAQSKKQIALWKFLNLFTDDAGKKIRFHIGETDNGLRVDIYGKFDKEEL